MKNDKHGQHIYIQEAVGGITCGANSQLYQHYQTKAREKFELKRRMAVDNHSILPWRGLDLQDAYNYNRPKVRGVWILKDRSKLTLI